MRTRQISKPTSSAIVNLKTKLGGLIKNTTRINRKKIIKFALLILMIVLAGNFLINRQRKTNDVSDSRKEVQGAKASQELNKEMSFPLNNASGEEVSRIKFVIEKAELRDEIVVKGQKATAISGRTFLILTLKVTNEHNQAVEIDTRDYIRLSINGNGEEWLAPDIHNDPVEVQAISTKYSRVGFPINDGDTDMTLRIGEINGDKEDVVLELK